MTQQSSGANAKVTIGIDLGDRRSRVYVLDAEGACIHERWVQAGRPAWEGFLVWVPENLASEFRKFWPPEEVVWERLGRPDQGDGFGTRGRRE
jgi:hypothetical protein